MADFAISTGFLSAADWRGLVIGARGFFDFTDGALQCVMLIDDFVSVKVIRRTALEFFETTVDNAITADPRLQLVVNGSYGDNQTAQGIFRRLLGTDPIEPSEQEIMGEVVENGVKTVGTPRPARAFFAFDHTNRTVKVPLRPAPMCSFGIGNPPTVDVGLGGLGPILIGGTKFDNSHSWYAALNAFAPQTGRIGIASSFATGVLLVFAQPQGTKPGLSVDQLRDKLSDAGFNDAVLLDGSDSVMVTRAGTRRIKQGPFKNRVTSVGLGFFYEAGRLPSPP